MTSFTLDTPPADGLAPAWQQDHLLAVWDWCTGTVWGCPMGSTKSAAWRMALPRPRGLEWGGVLRALRPWVIDVAPDSPLGQGASDGHRLVVPSHLLLQCLVQGERERHRWGARGHGLDDFLWNMAHAVLMHHQPGFALPKEHPGQEWVGPAGVVLSSATLDEALQEAGIVLPAVPALTPAQARLEWAARLAVGAAPEDLGEEPSEPHAQPALSAWRHRLCDTSQNLASWTRPWALPFLEEEAELSVEQVKERQLPFCVIPKAEEEPGTRFRCWNGVVVHPGLALSKHAWREATGRWTNEALSFHLGHAVADNDTALARKLLALGARADSLPLNQMLFDVKDASLIKPLIQVGADVHVDHHDAMGKMGVLEWACLSRPALVSEFLDQGARPWAQESQMPLSFRVAEHLCTRAEPGLDVASCIEALKALQSHGHALAGFHAIKIDRRLGGEQNKQSVDLLGWSLAQVAIQRHPQHEDLSWLRAWMGALLDLGVSAHAVAPHLPVLHVLASQGHPGMDFVGPLLAAHGASVLDVDGESNTALHALCQSVVVNTQSSHMDAAALEHARARCAELLSFVRNLPDAQVAFDRENALGQTPDAIVRAQPQAWQVFEPVWEQWAAQVREYRLNQTFPAAVAPPRLRM